VVIPFFLDLAWERGSPFPPLTGGEFYGSPPSPRCRRHTVQGKAASPFFEKSNLPLPPYWDGRRPPSFPRLTFFPLFPALLRRACGIPFCAKIFLPPSLQSRFLRRSSCLFPLLIKAKSARLPSSPQTRPGVELFFCFSLFLLHNSSN